MNAAARIPTGTSLYPQHRVKHWWYDMLDYLVANPHVHLRDLMSVVGRSYPTILAVYHSDAFQSMLIERRTQKAAVLDAAIHERSVKLAMQSLDIISEKLTKKQDAVPMTELVAISESALARLGYGSKQVAPSVSVNVNNGVQQVVAPVSHNALEEARRALQRVEQQNSAMGLPAPSSLQVIDQEATLVDQGVEQGEIEDAITLIPSP